MPCARNTLVLPNLYYLRLVGSVRIGAPPLLPSQRHAIRSVAIFFFYSKNVLYKLDRQPWSFGKAGKARTCGRGYGRLTDFFPNLERVVLRVDNRLETRVLEAMLKNFGYASAVEIVRAKEGRDDLQVVEELV
jgi:hypothetical protein